MTKNLETYLELAFGAADAPHARKDIIEKKVPRKLGHYHGGKLVSVRELLLSTQIESTSLIQTELYATVMEGAEPQKCMRDAIPILKANGSTLRVPKGETGTYAKMIAEGGEVPIDTQDYGYTDFTIHKFGVRPLITNEMIERSQYDVIAMEVRKAGQRIENSLNQKSLSVILENSGNEVDTTHSGTAVDERAAIAQAISANTVDGYISDAILMTPGFAGELLSTFTTGYTVQAGEITLTGKIPSIVGLKPFVCGVTDDSSTYVWENDTGGDIGALVIDSKNAGAIAMEKDIYVDKVQDPVRDILNCVVKARFGYNYFFANAACRIER